MRSVRRKSGGGHGGLRQSHQSSFEQLVCGVVGTAVTGMSARAMSHGAASRPAFFAHESQTRGAGSDQTKVSTTPSYWSGANPIPRSDGRLDAADAFARGHWRASQLTTSRLTWSVHHADKGITRGSAGAGATEHYAGRRSSTIVIGTTTGNSRSLGIRADRPRPAEAVQLTPGHVRRHSGRAGLCGQLDHSTPPPRIRSMRVRLHDGAIARVESSRASRYGSYRHRSAILTATAGCSRR